jgi:DNA-binding NtrC family response regulator
MEESVLSLLAALGKARTCEDAAAAALGVMLAVAAEGLAASPHAKSGKILRGMVHLRPPEGYRRLWILEHASGTSPAGSPSFLPSANAWRWVDEHRLPIAIDVQRGVADVGATGSPEAARRQDRRFDSQESQNRLLAREATHVLVLPVPTADGAVDGMISIEAHCLTAIGAPFVFPSLRDELQVLTDAAAPYLRTLPLRAARAAAPDAHLPVIGASMAGVVELLRSFAMENETVLLSGPTGAGKSRLARWCHEQSPRRRHPFVTVDLSAAPEELQMAELFGSKKGAFTSSIKDTPGAIERADNGTLFVDEIDKLSLKAQAGLLRVLEERKFRPLGDGADDRAARARFIVGTNTSLLAAVRAGRFREDLYYRVHVLPVKVPPLAERRDEIPAWAAYMLDRYRGGGARFSAEAEQVLSAKPWPGNLRQLDNIVKRACTLASLRTGAAPGELGIDARDVRQALAFEGDAGSPSLLEQLHLTAAAFVAEAERQAAAGRALDLDLADALRGFVLGTAVLKLESKEKAFRLFGKADMVRNRNHKKLLDRDMERVSSLCRALGDDVENPFASLYDAGDP